MPDLARFLDELQGRGIKNPLALIGEVLIHGVAFLGSNGFKLVLTGAIGLRLVEFSARRG